MRSFYRVKIADVPVDERDPASFGCVLLAKYSGWALLHSSIDPNERLESIGGVRVAGTWKGLKHNLTALVGAKVFRKIVKRGKETLWIRHEEEMLGDVTVRQWMIPHSWLGDGPSESVE